MTEACLEFAKQYMPDLIALGFGTGSLLSVITVLAGYAISKAQSLVNDK